MTFSLGSGGASPVNTGDPAAGAPDTESSGGDKSTLKKLLSSLGSDSEASKLLELLDKMSSKADESRAPSTSKGPDGAELSGNDYATKMFGSQSQSWESFSQRGIAGMGRMTQGILGKGADSAGGFF